jgi:hypothetical protein
MIRTLLYSLFLLNIWACQNDSTKPVATTAPQGLHLGFGQNTLLRDREPANWCSQRWAEAISISADAVNTNRRYFALGSGAHRVAVDYGKLTASFCVRSQTADEVRIYTSDNFLCCSDRKNFNMASDAQSFRYDNGMGVHFEAGVEARPNGLVFWIEMPPGAGYGVLAHRCEGCK